MITRRNVRIKVMQSVYTAIQSTEPNLSAYLQKDVKQSLEKTKELYFYIIKTLVNICGYAQKDALKRASKHLPTKADLATNTKLSQNTIIVSILESEEYKAYNKATKYNQMISMDIIKELYTILIATPEYAAYIKNTERTAMEEKEIVRFIISDILYPSESFEELTDDFFTNWDDDADMLRTILLAQVAKPEKFNISNLVDSEKNKFALELAACYADKLEHCEKLYFPKLKNWDQARIAILDKVIVTLAICEFLYFETIPTKVTLNEYIDLAKSYSTKQSGQFVNGILDSLLKDLEAENSIVKKQMIKY